VGIEQASNLYTVRGAARVLGCSKDTILRRIREGEIAAVKLGRSHVIDINDARRLNVRRYTRKAS
jgi:excisionase family DNA binding protein